MPPGVAPLVLFTTLARSDRAFSRFMAAGLLDKGPLGLREREIMIDRTCARCGSEYEWGVHIGAVRASAWAHARADPGDGRGRARTTSGARGSSSSSSSPTRSTTLRRSATSCGRSWRGEFSDEQILELILLAGFYHTVAYLTNGLRLPLEAYAARFPAEPS